MYSNLYRYVYFLFFYFYEKMSGKPLLKDRTTREGGSWTKIMWSMMA